MKFRSIKSFGALLALVFLTVTSSVITPLTAHAGIFDDWVFYGSVGRSEGYFSNNGMNDTTNAALSGCGYGRCPVLPNDNYARDAINGGYYRAGNINRAVSAQRAQNLVADLRAWQSLGGWNASGSGFIVNTMLGYGSDNPNKTRNPSPAMYAELEARLVDRAQKGLINWNIDFSSNGQDTFTRKINGNWDVVYNQTSEIRNGLIIYDDFGGEAYRIWYSCGNPVGAISGVPVVTPYNLVPTITATPTIITNPDSTVSLTPIIRNSQAGTSKSANWETTRFVLPPGSAIPTGATNPTTPKTYYGNGATTIATGSGTFTSTSPQLSVPDHVVGEYVVGTRICFALSVAPYNQTSANWRHSTPVCVSVGIKPKVQVLGGDLVVGRATAYNSAATSNVATSSSFSTSTDSRYGSWSEYAIIPSGTVRGMASASTYSGGSTFGSTSDDAICSLSLLTISNNTGSSCQSASIGKYVSSSSAPNIASRFPIPSPLPASQNLTAASVNIRNLAPSLVYSSTQADLSINSSSAFGAGRWVIINAPNTTVTITSNINYDTSAALTNINAIPQVIIIAKNIKINESVTNVDAWLIATGTGGNGYINTCNTVAVGAPSTLNSKICNKPLTVNGPVLANKLYMYRTGGSGIGADMGDPAEVFNLRADAYLWSSAYGSNTGRIPTVSTKELPPRF